jgi:iron complex transport system ATP-binding protein
MSAPSEAAAQSAPHAMATTTAMTATTATPATTATTATIEAIGVAYAYGPRRVLDDLNIHFARGWTSIVGPNGAGKSTLLRVLAGLVHPLAGEVRIDGTPMPSLTAARRAQRVAWLAQGGEVSGELGVRDTVALGRLPHLGAFGAPTPRDDAAVERAMAATECAAWADRRLAELSGGERQLVLLARALATEAPILLLDEPTTHLDAPHQVALARLARHLARERTVVSVMHDLPLAFAADRVVVMRAGRIEGDGAPGDAALQAAARAAFDDAVRFEPRDGGVSVTPDLRRHENT